MTQPELLLFIQSFKKQFLPADGKIEVVSSNGQSFDCSYSKQQLEKLNRRTSSSLGFRVLFDNHEGYASTTSLDEGDIRLCLKMAFENAQMITSEVNWSQLFKESKILQKSEMKSLSVSQGQPINTQLTIQDRLNVAKTTEQRILEASESIQSVPYNGYSESDSQWHYLDTDGRERQQTSHSYTLYAHALAQNGANDSVMRGETSSEFTFEALNADFVVATATEKVLRALGGQTPKTGTYTVVFKSKALQTLWGLFVGSFSAQRLYDKTSPLSSRLHQRIVSPLVTLIDDPLNNGRRAYSPFDSEGGLAQACVLIEDGVFKSALTDRKHAHLLNIPSTGHGQRSPGGSIEIHATNITMKAGSTSFESLTRTSGELIVIEQFMSSAGYNSSNADFSLEAAGRFYEDGQDMYPIKNFMVAGNFLKLLSQIECVGDDLPTQTDPILCPSIRVTEIMVAGK